MYEPLKKTSKFCLFVGGEPTCLRFACFGDNLSDLSQKARANYHLFRTKAGPLVKWQINRNQRFDKQQNREVLEAHDVCFFNTPFKKKSHFLIFPSNWSQCLASLCHLLSRNETHISQKSDSETVFRTTTPPYVGLFYILTSSSYTRPGLTNRAHEVFTGEKEVHATGEVITCREKPPIFARKGCLGGQWHVVLKKE